jgi:hypothetical protein
MSSIKLESNASGTGIFTIASPNSNTNRTLTLPDATGTFLTNSGTEAGAFSTLSVNSNNISAENSLGFRNRIINGDMRIDQRNAGASVTPTVSDYTLDRWHLIISQSSKFTTQQNAGSVTPPTGFSNYLGITSSSAYSVTSGDFFVIDQRIEGFNTSDLAWGTANAKTITISFWVRSSLTGTFGGAIRNSAQDRSYPFSYTISSANTWEQKFVTIAGDTSGTWVGSTNGVGLSVNFSFGTGTTYSGTAGAWSASNLVSVTGATSVVGTNGATFYITGVQLEVGSVATPFERRPYGAELALCQRYYRIRTTPAGAYIQGTNGQCISTTRAYISNMLETMGMRAAPTATFSAGSTFRVFNASGSGIDCTAITANAYYQDSPITAYVDVASGLVAGDVTTLVSSNGTACTIQASAEL